MKNFSKMALPNIEEYTKLQKVNAESFRIFVLNFYDIKWINGRNTKFTSCFPTARNAQYGDQSERSFYVKKKRLMVNKKSFESIVYENYRW